MSESPVYEMLIDAINPQKIKQITSLEIDDTDKKKLIAYTIFRQLDGMGGTKLELPKKRHKVGYAEVLVKHNFPIEDVMELAEVSRVTVFRKRKELGNER